MGFLRLQFRSGFDHGDNAYVLYAHCPCRLKCLALHETNINRPWLKVVHAASPSQSSNIQHRLDSHRWHHWIGPKGLDESYKFALLFSVPAKIYDVGVIRTITLKCFYHSITAARLYDKTWVAWFFYDFLLAQDEPEDSDTELINSRAYMSTCISLHWRQSFTGFSSWVAVEACVRWWWLTRHTIFL